MLSLGAARWWTACRRRPRVPLRRAVLREPCACQAPRRQFARNVLQGSRVTPAAERRPGNFLTC
jgi:hypothetical protein